MAKTGPTANNASAEARLIRVPRLVTELGYDLRKPDSYADPRGSRCGAGSPRCDITTEDGSLYFIGCSSPPPFQQATGNGWIRLRWGGSVPLFAYSTSGALVNVANLNVKRIDLVFDEGQDTGPDNFGLAVLDNIDVNGVLVGRGPTDAATR